MRSLRLLLLAVCFALALAPAELLLAQTAPSNGVITGTILNGTPGGQAPGAIPLHLRKFRGQTELEAKDASAAADSSFKFEGLDSAPDLSDFLEAGYKNVAYRSDEIKLAGRTTPVTINVYDLTNSDVAISIDTALIEFSTPDQKSGTIGVTERITYINDAPATFVGDIYTDKVAGHSVLLTLPTRAFDITPGHGFEADGAVAVGNQVGSRAPIPPGQTTLILAYVLPYEGAALSMERHFPYAMKQLFVLIANGTPELGSSTLANNGTVTFDGNQFKVLSGADLKANQSFTVAVSKLPAFVDVTSSGLSRDRVVRGMGIGLMGVAILFVGAYTIAKRRKGFATALPFDDLANERQALLTAIAQLDSAKENGTLQAEEHLRLREQRKQRLLDVTLLIREREALALEQAGG